MSQYLGTDWNYFLEKLCFLGCDGESVMTAYGVLKQKWQCIVPVYCFAHKLELAFKDAAKKLKLYEKLLQMFAMGLYYFHHYSTLNKPMMKCSFKVLNMHVFTPTRGTRWIGHLNCVLTNITRRYTALMQHLQQVN